MAAQQYNYDSVEKYFSFKFPYFCMGKLALSTQQKEKKASKNNIKSDCYPSVSFGVLPSSALILFIIIDGAKFWFFYLLFCYHIAKIAN